MENNIAKKIKINKIINKFDRVDNVARNSLFVIIIVQAVLTIAMSYFISSVSFFGIITTSMLALEVIVLYIWMTKKGHAHMVELNKLVEQVYGKVKAEDMAVAEGLLQYTQAIIETKLLLQKGRFYSFFVALWLRGEIKSALEGIRYGVRLDALEGERLLARLGKYLGSADFASSKKQEADRLLADMESLFASASYTLD